MCQPTELIQWGLDISTLEQLPERLTEFYERYRPHFRNCTRDPSQYGYDFLSGLLRLESGRTISQIARTAGVAEQNMQQFISDSPWSAPNVIKQVQEEIAAHPHYQEGSVLLIDESADEKSGDYSAGAGRQYNGRLGKVELSQVGVFLSLTKSGYPTWVDGALYVPASWFKAEAEAKRKKVGLPPEQEFQTKLELALDMVKRAHRNQLPFEAIDCDSLYGRKGWLRDQFDQLGYPYYADVPESYQVYLSQPEVELIAAKSEQACPTCNVVGTVFSVKQVKEEQQTHFQKLTLRPHERGWLIADFARRQVWTVRPDGSLRQEWLLIRQDANRTTYSLSNASSDTSLLTMAQRKSERFFIERSNQDAKSEFGWDEFQAIKFQAWHHQLALTLMASWFITQTRLEWREVFSPQPELLHYYETDPLPQLSVANVRTLLRATMPLPQLSLTQAAQLVVKHLDNRARSRKSRLNKARSP